MSKVCQVTGKRPVTGHNVSHSNIKTKRRFEPNLHYHRFWVESEKRFVRLRVSSKGMRIIDKKGIDSVLADIRAAARGFKAKKGAESWQPVRFAKRSVWCPPRARVTLHHHQEQASPSGKDGNQKFDPVARKHVIYKEAKIK